MKRFTHKKRKGFTLIEALALLVIFSIATIIFYQSFALAVKLMIEAKKRLSAVALATERMEHMRSTPYEEIAIVGGVPAGKIIADENVVINDIGFRMIFEVIYVDDPNDNLVSTPAPNNDVNFVDYKRVKIYVLWGAGISASIGDAKSSNQHKNQRITLTSQFIPPGGLEGPTRYGALSINTLQSDGGFVDGATVRIFCEGCSSPNDNFTNIDTTFPTDTQGNIIVPVPPSADGVTTTSNYIITVSKAGYETVSTKLPYDGAITAPNEGSYRPTNEHLTVLQGELTTATFVMDPLSTFAFFVRDPFCLPLTTPGPYNVTMVGGRLLGTNPGNSDADIFALDSFWSNEIVTTDANGGITIRTDTNDDGTIDGSDDASHGKYTVDKDLFESTYTGLVFWKMLPSNDDANNAINIDTTPVNCNFIVIDKSVDSVFVTIIDDQGDADPLNDAPIEGATVRLQSTILGETFFVETDRYGKAYFPSNSTTSLSVANYDMRVSAIGYYDEQRVIAVSGLQQITINPTTAP